jgi:ABC-2 type transport system ATP-binding protein
VTVIAVRDLVKDYAGRPAVDGISFTVERGEVYGLLGENGAGKSTTVEILEGHRTRTSGAVTVLGEDPGSASRAFRDRIGIVLQSSGIERQLTVSEELTLYRQCYRRRRTVAECVDLVGLGESIDKRVETLSGGQKRRLDLALGIVGCPELLFLDEPTTGFDAAARRNAWDLIRSLGDDGTTVVLTSHYLDEVEHLADRVGVLARGRLVAEGTPATLTGALGTTTIRFQLPADTTVGEIVGRWGSDVSNHAGVVTFTTESPTAALHSMTSWAVERGVELAAISVTRPSLEDMFLELTANEAAAE